VGVVVTVNHHDSNTQYISRKIGNFKIPNHRKEWGSAIAEDLLQLVFAKKWESAHG